MTFGMWTGYIGLLAAVLLTGHALFWAMMALSLGRDRDPAEVRSMLGIVGRSRWPHVVVPWAWRLPFASLGFVFLLLVAIATLGASGITPAIGALLLAVAACNVLLALRPSPPAAYADLGLTLALVSALALPPGSGAGFDLYATARLGHVLAAALWLGHMFVWSLFGGPALKRVQPTATAEFLRERSLYLGGLGWPALVVLGITGIPLLMAHGIGIADLLTGAAFAGPGGGALAVKLALVLAMVVYQAVFAHRPTQMVHLNMAAALAVLALAVVLSGGGI